MSRDYLPAITLAALLCAGCGTAAERNAVPKALPTPEVTQTPAAEPAPPAEIAPAEETALPGQSAPAGSSAPVGELAPAAAATPVEAFKAIVAGVTNGLPQAVAGLANDGVPGKVSYKVSPADSPEAPQTAVLTFSTRNNSADHQSTCLWTAKYDFQDHQWRLSHLDWQTTSYTSHGNAGGGRSKDVVELRGVLYPQGNGGMPKDNAIIKLLKGE